MKNIAQFCSCTNLDYPLHPTKHEKGCAPCIAKNLGKNEIPNCFFNKLEGAQERTGDQFEDFARLVIEEKK